MIKLENVNKTYKSKKSKNTNALNDVSLIFDNTGMTFILGKSGSGKSTLLNVLGGLDKYDSGDMLILGKSSKDFTQADFDSYRNTYVGFIFQEFNILEDYDVYENIVLALKLQQKEINEKEIDELLNKLELIDLKKRKLNELSGGQKQRVAIARALVKNPKIILADEPTGNLDSKTGSQVMDLLKEISKEKLVIIVSHDEEYAKKYGDRIIEIKDGKIINDTNEIKTSDITNTYKTIKSYLPFKESFKLGLGSLKHKKIKLIFTIFLTVLTLGFLSCADTLSSYDFSDTHARLLKERNEEFFQIEKKHIFVDSDGFKNITTIPLEEKDIKTIKNELKEGYDVYKYNNEIYADEFTITSLLHIQNDYIYEPYEIVSTSNISNIIKEDIIGRKPQNPNEIVISNRVADLIIENGIEVYENVVSNEFVTSKIFKPKTYDEILNAEYNYYLGFLQKVKIVGIVDYDINKFNQEYINNVLNKIFVMPEFIDSLNKIELNFLKNYFETDIFINNFTPVIESEDGYMNSYSYLTPATLDHEIEYFDGTIWKKTNTLKENEVILSIDQLNINGENYYNDLNNYINNNIEYEEYEVLEKKFLANYITQKNVIGQKVNLKIYYDKYWGDLEKEFDNLIVAGVYYRDDYCKNINNENICLGSYYNYFSKDLLKDYLSKQIEKTSILYPIKDYKDIKRITNIFPVEAQLAIKSTYSEALHSEKGILDSIKILAFYASLVFLVFTIFLIINFMFTSITYRKKEIGVLRALGSRSKDIMKIFIWEGVSLSLVSGTIASILLVVVSNFMNKFIMGQISMLTTPFIVGIRQFIVIYILVFLVTTISTILPIIKISKMKPIDAILNK
ncbi:MAG: ATP-binding cassette domain-containing protein [Bacilli bacterium]|nr:ATP-binding cassette domain-containing protein [Bacilli bacterium]